MAINVLTAGVAMITASALIKASLFNRKVKEIINAN